MRERLESVFRFGATEVTLVNNITYHDHFYRIEKALWPLICEEVAKVLPWVRPEGFTDRGDIFGYELDKMTVNASFTLQQIRNAAVEAVIPLGYTREGMAAVANKWMRECAENGLNAILDPDIYGPTARFRPGRLLT